MAGASDSARDDPAPAGSGSGPATIDPAPAARDRLNLIEQLSRDSVASDYAGVRPEPGESSRRQRVLVAAIALGVTGFVLALGVSARILNAPVVADQKNALLQRIEGAAQRQEDLGGAVQDLRDEVQQARSQDLELTLEGLALAESVRQYELVTGYVAVTGPGVVVTLTDPPPPADGALGELERVLDSDVQAAVNGLWSAGAEAVAVNGQRLSARSAIRSAAGAILVNYRPLRPPYVVEAIGPPDLEERFAASGDAAVLRGVAEQYGIGFTTKSADDLRLPAATSALPESAEVVRAGEGETR